QVDGLVVTNSAFDDNTFGWYIEESQAGKGGLFNNVTVTGSTFNNNLEKGLYIEKLSNALFDGITVDNSGTSTHRGWNAGIDINLRFGDYRNVTIQNSAITNSGAKGASEDPPFPIAVTIKARDDGSYSAPPA